MAIVTGAREERERNSGGEAAANRGGAYGAIRFHTWLANPLTILPRVVAQSIVDENNLSAWFEPEFNQLNVRRGESQKLNAPSSELMFSAFSSP